MSEWRAIDSAPKDGTAIVVARFNWPGGWEDKCHGWNAYVVEWWGDEEGWICYMDQVREPKCPIDPDHWMPLPSAPK